MKEEFLHGGIPLFYWFYYIVTNRPYTDAWLDEGLTEFTTALYLTEKYNESRAFSFSNHFLEYNETSNIVNGSIDYLGNYYVPTVYGRSPMKMWEFFEEKGTKEALAFMSEYYQDHRFEKVTTKEFAQYFEDYFEGEQSEFLSSWLDY